MTKSEEQVKAPEVQVDTTEKEVEATTEKVEATSKEQDVDKRLKGQIAELQRQRDELRGELTSFKQSLATAIVGEGSKEEVTIDGVLEEVRQLKEKLARKESEEARNRYIDSLDVAEGVKQLLKKRIAPSENLETEVQSFLEDLNITTAELAKTRVVSESRPLSGGISSVGRATSANEILDNDEAYRKAHNI
jgi:hypothetical protein